MLCFGGVKVPNKLVWYKTLQNIHLLSDIFNRHQRFCLLELLGLQLLMGKNPAESLFSKLFLFIKLFLLIVDN